MPDAKAAAAPVVVDVPLPDVCGHFERGPSETTWHRTNTPELDHAPDPAAPAGNAGAGAAHTDPNAGTGTGTNAPAAGAGTGSSSGTTSP